MDIIIGIVDCSANAVSQKIASVFMCRNRNDPVHIYDKWLLFCAKVNEG